VSPGKSAAKDGKARQPFLRRAMPYFVSGLATFLVLELVTRSILPLRAPVHLRDGIYISQFPLVSGRQNVSEYVDVEELPIEKEPGEIRIFVFGESSVQGSPWDIDGSAPTMLYDQLHKKLPGKHITVVNMGRGSAVMRDSYYFLEGIREYGPDFVVFYQGGNDFFNTELELCLPAKMPAVDHAWRWLVRHSRFVWAYQALGRFYFVRLLNRRTNVVAPGGGGGWSWSCEDAGFPTWTDLLVRTAQDTGARVIVTTPVENPLRAAEGSENVQWGLDKPVTFDGRDERYRRLVGCIVTEGCDVAEAWHREGYALRDWVHVRDDAWRETARRRGVHLIDFEGYLQTELDGGLHGSVFQEELHLTFEGYWLLASLWQRELAPMIDQASPPAGTTFPQRFDRAAYVNAWSQEGRRSPSCRLLECAATYVRMNQLVHAADLLRAGLREERVAPGAPATTRAGLTEQLALAWLRRRLGLPAAFPQPIEARVDGLSFEALMKGMRDHPDCSTVGGADVDALLAERPSP
jgi:hypothetical protein